MGDTGAGKSETLEAFRALGGPVCIQDIIIIADDMGSLEILPEGKVIGYGTEIGAFLRLDDLQQGYALGQIDRAIIMNANQINARIILPVTSFNNVIKGHQLILFCMPIIMKILMKTIRLSNGSLILRKLLRCSGKVR